MTIARPWVKGVLLAACACNGEGPRRETQGLEPAPASSAARSEGLPPAEQSSAPDLPVLCLLAGADGIEREDTFTDVAFEYHAQTDACRTRRLTSGMSMAQTGDWLNYLINYSHALFGCGLWFEPLPGGVDAFGPANIEAVGLPRATLGADDAALLIDLYLGSCTAWLTIPGPELAQLRQRLEAAALPRIGASASASLSECP